MNPTQPYFKQNLFTLKSTELRDSIWYKSRCQTQSLVDSPDRMKLYFVGLMSIPCHVCRTEWWDGPSTPPLWFGGDNCANWFYKTAGGSAEAYAEIAENREPASSISRYGEHSVVIYYCNLSCVIFIQNHWPKLLIATLPFIFHLPAQHHGVPWLTERLCQCLSCHHHWFCWDSNPWLTARKLCTLTIKSRLLPCACFDA